jgi:hypothetical protein
MISDGRADADDAEGFGVRRSAAPLLCRRRHCNCFFFVLLRFNSKTTAISPCLLQVVVRVKPDASPAAQGVLQVRNGNGIRVVVPNNNKPLDFDGFSWVAGPQSTQDDMMARA